MNKTFADLKLKKVFDDPKKQRLYEDRLDELRDDPMVKKIWAGLEEAQEQMAGLQADLVKLQQPAARRARFTVIRGGGNLR